ncbi:MAG: hypothetical protein ACXV2I_14595 [Actinomycetes bacterium]
MTTFDYALNVALIGLVLLQLRGRRLDRRGLLLPLGLVLWAASRYLHGIPTDGNDGVIVGAGLLAGAALGTWSALLTRLHRGADGVAVARATAGAALLWVLGIGSRMAFALYTQYGGAPTVARFSIAHRPDGAGLVTALVLMAFAEVISRTLMLWVRSRALSTAPPAPALSVG